MADETKTENRYSDHTCSICNDNIFRYAYVVGGNVYCNRCMQDKLKVSVSQIDDVVYCQLKEEMR